MTPDEARHTLEQALAKADGLAFAVLIGSRATNRTRPESDWDIAVQWLDVPRDPLEQFARDETLRRQIADALGIAETDVDIVNLTRANLAMRAAVAEEGRPLFGEDGLPWMRFLTRTWRDLEHWYLEQRYEA